MYPSALQTKGWPLPVVNSRMNQGISVILDWKAVVGQRSSQLGRCLRHPRAEGGI